VTWRPENAGEGPMASRNLGPSSSLTAVVAALWIAAKACGHRRRTLELHDDAPPRCLHVTHRRPPPPSSPATPLPAGFPSGPPAQRRALTLAFGAMFLPCRRSVRFLLLSHDHRDALVLVASRQLGGVRERDLLLNSSKAVGLPVLAGPFTVQPTCPARGRLTYPFSCGRDGQPRAARRNAWNRGIFPDPLGAMSSARHRSSRRQ
jgi:hypothetical protein